MNPDAPAQPAPRRRRGWLIGTAIAAGVLVAGGTFAFQEVRLARNLRKARDHVPVVQAKLAEDNRFLGVTVAETPAGHGSLRVGGFVIADADADLLRDAVDATRPPVPLDWQVRVIGAAALGEALTKIRPPATAPAPAD
jgi:hypothetical protein